MRESSGIIEAKSLTAAADAPLASNTAPTIRLATSSANLSILSQVRAIQPSSPVSMLHAKRLAERQALRMRDLLGLSNECPFPSEAIESLPRVRVVRSSGLSVSGATQWSSHHRQWVIVVNTEEPVVRQRFSLAHELKHVIDHHVSSLLAWDEPGMSASAKAETLADYFAACLLMPTRLVVDAWKGSGGNLPEMASQFGVSVPAMTVRCSQLRLTRPVPRCGYAPLPMFRPRSSAYFRFSSWKAEGLLTVAQGAAT